jgi:hypothetical protein
MKAHVVENGVIVNSIAVDSLDFMPNLVVDPDDKAGIGWLYQNGVFIDPNPEPTIPVTTV